MGKAGKKNVLTLVELGPDGEGLPISLECISTGRKLADQFGGRQVALIMGASVTGAAEELSHYQGIDEVCVADHALLECYHPEAHLSALEQVCAKLKPKAIVMGQTLTSIDLAPRLAFSLNTGLITDCVGMEFESGEVLFIKPVYSSNIMAAYGLSTEPCLVTMRSRAEEPADRKNKAGAKVVAVDVDIDAAAMKIEVIERVLEEEEGPRLTSADIIVSGGRGIGGPEGFAQLSDLAGVLQAALGASRPPCDLGWISAKAQVGQTGEIVGPSLYVAVGISGATQHLAGMAGSKTIVAINKDPKAGIFKIADYGVVGRYEEVVPAFTEALSEVLK